MLITLHDFVIVFQINTFRWRILGNIFFNMEPTQTINLIALSLIVVMHAGVLALRLGISLGRN